MNKTKSKKIMGTLVAVLLFSGVLHAQNLPIDSTNRALLNEVIVTQYDRSLTPVYSATIIQKSDIQNPVHIGNGSVNNIFDQVPSIITTSDAGTGLGYTYMRIRGIDHTRINVTINGIALNDAESQGTWFTNLPDFGSKIGQLNVQRGVGTSNCGAAAFGASMNFSTITQSLTPTAELTTSAGSYNTFRNSITVATGNIKDIFSSTISYSNILSNGYMDNASAKLNSIFWTTNIKLPSKASNSSILKFNILYGNEKTGLAWNGTPLDSMETNRQYNSCGLYYDDNMNVQHYDNETDNYTQTHYQLFYDYWNKKHSFLLNVGTHFTRGFGYYEEYKEDKTFDDYGLNPIAFGNEMIESSDFITRKYLDNYFYGFTFSTQQIIHFEKEWDNYLVWKLIGGLNNYDGAHYGTIIWAQNNPDLQPDYHWYDGTGDKLQGNLAATASYNYKHWAFYVDMQYRFINYVIGGFDDRLVNIDQNYRWHFMNPKASVSYECKSTTKQNVNLTHNFYFSFARAMREPTRSDIVDAPMSGKPIPETLYDFELGYLLDAPKYRFNGNGYFMYYDNQLVLTGQINDVGAAIMSNVDKSYRLGIELVSDYRPVKFFRWQINVTLSLNKILNYTNFTETYDDEWNFLGMTVENLGNRDISFSPNLIATNEFLFYPVKNFEIGIVSKFVGKQYIDNANDENYVIKPYSVSNLNFGYTIEKIKKIKLHLFFSVNNIFNAKYTSNAWLYRCYTGESIYYSDGYFPQATINFMGGIKITF